MSLPEDFLYYGRELQEGITAVPGEGRSVHYCERLRVESGEFTQYALRLRGIGYIISEGARLHVDERILCAPDDVRLRQRLDPPKWVKRSEQKRIPPVSS